MRSMTRTAEHARVGVLFSLAASALFGTIFLLAGISDASPEWLFAWRMIITLACYALLLLTRAGRRYGRAAWATVRRTRWMPLLLAATAFLVGVQMWLFAWAPAHGYALDATLGYLLLPIGLVFVGRIAFRDRVSALQWVAIGVAACAVLLSIVETAALSWVTAVIAAGYALYFGLRRRFRLEGPEVFAMEVALITPVAAALIASAWQADAGAAPLPVLLFGLSGTAAMVMYLAAASRLSMPVFGLLTYVEPVLMFVVALLLGEHLSTTDVWVYLLLAVALAALGVDGIRRPRAHQVHTAPAEDPPER